MGEIIIEFLREKRAPKPRDPNLVYVSPTACKSDRGIDITYREFGAPEITPNYFAGNLLNLDGKKCTIGSKRALLLVVKNILQERYDAGFRDWNVSLQAKFDEAKLLYLQPKKARMHK